MSFYIQQIHVYPEPVNVTILGERIFVDIIKDLHVKCSCIRVDPKSNSVVLTWEDSREGSGKAEADQWCVQKKEGRQPLEVRRNVRMDFPWSL